MQLGGLPLETDVSTGVWISSGRRRGTPGTVGALVPAVFAAAPFSHSAGRPAGTAWRVCSPPSVSETTSPGCTSRRNVAPMMSNAHVSDATQ